MGIMARKAPFPLSHGSVYDFFVPGRVLVALKTEPRNGFRDLPRSFGKVQIVAHGAVLPSDRLMDEPVLEKGLVAVLGMNCQGNEQDRQDDWQYQDVKSRTAHPDMLITAGSRCQPEDSSFDLRS